DPYSQVQIGQVVAEMVNKIFGKTKKTYRTACLLDRSLLIWVMSLILFNISYFSKHEILKRG
ncbi:MAG: hypothetical protein KC587_18435, partial [Nitrospira sp.]|nr:hypothetical protein [Nitrospira sp.]